MAEQEKRRENYNNTPTPLSKPEPGLGGPRGLDFLGKERVNPEDLTGGTPNMRDLESNGANATARRPHLTPVDGLLHLIDEDAAAADNQGKRPVAVLYLRVSTSRQTHTASDVDEDGNSIATQRDHTLKKARQLKATIAQEFVEPGASARSIDKRPVFKAMLQYIDEHPQITHVIAYQRSRMFRSVADSAIVETALAQKGIEIVSAKEDYAKGADGLIMKTITDAFNQWQSQKNGEDISLKMAHKVEQGGTVGRAKLGYLNVRIDFNGRLVNTIDIDPVRAPLIKWAFEQYATGEFSVTQLRAELEAQGLTTRSSANSGQSTVSSSQLSQILGDPYYTGVIRYKGRLYAGRHEPLITKELFLQVQDVLRGRNRRGSRDLIHFHFLKGMIFCATCRDEGRTSRLVYSQTNGNGGTYEYFVCSAKARGDCAQPRIRVDELEAAVGRLVAGEGLDSGFLEALVDEIDSAMDDLNAQERELQAAMRRELTQLDAKEDRLIDAIADGEGSSIRLKQRLEEISLKRQAIAERLDRMNSRLEEGAEAARAYLELLKTPGELYASDHDAVKREIITLFFKRIFVRVRDTGHDVTGDRTEVNARVHELRVGFDGEGPNKLESPDISAGAFELPSAEAPFVSFGCNKTYLVAGTGFEPATSGL